MSADVGRCDDYPKVIECSGGFFAVEKAGGIGSGAWKTREAAQWALKAMMTEGDDAPLWDLAHAAERQPARAQEGETSL